MTEGEKRRSQIIKILKDSKSPVSGTKLAKVLKVSRQVIVQDMALLRAQRMQILSTYKGYFLDAAVKEQYVRIFRVHHDTEHTLDELQLIVDYGGHVEDVFVYHKIYGIVRADLHIASRNDIKEFLGDLKNGHSALLKNITSDYHYHTVSAPSEKLLDLIQGKLQERGFLAELKDYEPINFWEKETKEKDKE